MKISDNNLVEKPDFILLQLQILLPHLIVLLTTYKIINNIYVLFLQCLLTLISIFSDYTKAHKD